MPYDPDARRKRKANLARREGEKPPEPRTLDDLMPTDPLMIPPWFACMQWAISSKPTMDQFFADTGSKYVAPRNGIERMIDEAAGMDIAFLRTFAKWMNENIWGPRDIVAGSDSEDTKEAV